MSRGSTALFTVDLFLVWSVEVLFIANAADIMVAADSDQRSRMGRPLGSELKAVGPVESITRNTHILICYRVDDAVVRITPHQRNTLASLHTLNMYLSGSENIFRQVAFLSWAPKEIAGFPQVYAFIYRCIWRTQYWVLWASICLCRSTVTPK